MPIQLVIVLLIVVAGALRLFQLGDDSLWLDEAYSYWFSGQTWAMIWGRLASYDIHPPMYYSLLKLWRVFGDSEFAMRSLSALASTAAVPFVYLIGRETGQGREGQLAGILAAALFALSPWHLDFAQQARPYALLTLAIAVGLSGSAWLVTHPEAMLRPWLDCRGFLALIRNRGAGGKSAFPAWSSVILGSAAALWLHNTAFVFVASLGLIGLWFAAKHEFRRALIGNYALVGTLIVAIWAPFAVTFIEQFGGVARDSWTPELSWRRSLGPLSLLLDIKSIEPLTVAPILAILAYIGVENMKRSGRRDLVILLVGVFALAYALIMLFSLVVHPIVIERVFVWMSLPCLVAIAAGLAGLKRYVVKAASILVVFGVSAYGCWQFVISPSHEPWRQIAEHISVEAGIGEAVLTVPNSLTIPLSYYLKPLRADIELIGLPEPFPAQRHAHADGSGVVANPGIISDDVPLIYELAESVSGVWVVERLAPYFDPDGLVLSTMRAERSQIFEVRVANHMTLYRFE